MKRGVFLIALSLIGLSLRVQPFSAQTPKTSNVEMIRFTGSVTRGQVFERSIGRNMVFRLNPGGEGWGVSVVIKQRPEDEHREACEPLHGGSECDFLGEYFMPNSRSADYLKSKVRMFQVGLGRLLPASDEEKRQNPDWWRTPNYEKWGTGTFTIEDIKVGAASGNEDPWIDSMKFGVELRLPR
jgi:hypothetical protein